MEVHTNSSNNTLYADADGNIAYFHSNFIPKRDPKFDWTKPVDGSESRDRVERRAVVRRIAERRQPAERLGLQHQQLSVLGGRPRQQPEAEGLSGLRRFRQRESARRPRHPGADGKKGLHARLADHGRAFDS